LARFGFSCRCGLEIRAPFALGVNSIFMSNRDMGFSLGWLAVKGMSPIGTHLTRRFDDSGEFLDLRKNG
jgi:hypothetical protein